MEITSRLDFAADPSTVHSMMTDKGWLTELVAEAGAQSHSIDVAGTSTRVAMTVPAPAELAKFAGSGIKLQQTASWDEAAADGSRTGTLVVEAQGLPVRMDGTARLHPGGRGSIVEYTGDLKVNIPFVGKKVEQQAAPYVKQAIDAQQAVGDRWLAARG